jgi:hypothetical protein
MITESPIIVPIGTIGLLSSVIVLAVLIAGEIEKHFESNWPSLKSVNGELFKIHKNAISSERPINDNIVEISIDHDGFIDLNKVLYQFNSLDLSNLETIIRNVNDDNAFKEVVKDEIHSSKFKINCVFISDNTVTYCFTVDHKAIPWGIDVDYKNDKYDGIEFGH